MNMVISKVLAMWDSNPGRCQGGLEGQKTGVALLIRHRGHCEPLWAVVPPLQVELSSACSVASLGRFPSHYLPGRLCLRPGVLADHLFGWGIPSTRQAGRETVHNASSVKSLYRAQGGMTLPNEKNLLKSWTKLAARLGALWGSCGRRFEGFGHLPWWHRF